MDLPLTRLHEVTTGDDGVLRGMRVELQAPDRIAVWTGVVDPTFARSTANALDAADFRERSVVHFIGWDQIQAFYSDTPFAELVETLRERVIRLSTLPRSDGA
ncbi:MAG: hypothetical protein J0L88_09565 [Xanthomonadales bacterium]|nr:hypothetical protein [Xanthomonadales bacterium]